MGYSLESTKILKYNVMRGKLIKKCCIGEDEEKTSALRHYVDLPGWMAESKFALWVPGALVQIHPLCSKEPVFLY